MQTAEPMTVDAGAGLTERLVAVCRDLGAVESVAAIAELTAPGGA